jgi:hypothetical protein
VIPFHIYVSSPPSWLQFVQCGFRLHFSPFHQLSQNTLIVIAFTYTMTARHLVESSRSISEGTKNPQPSFFFI